MIKYNKVCMLMHKYVVYSLPGTIVFSCTFCVGGGIISASAVPLQRMPHIFANKFDHTLLPSWWICV